MSLLDAAKAIAEKATPIWDSPYNDAQVCSYCGEYRIHASDCVLRAMPKIVAALEALSDILDSQGLHEPTVDEVEGGFDGPYYLFCERRVKLGHKPDCPWNRAVLAAPGSAS